MFDPFCGGGTTLVEAVSPISVHDKREIVAWIEFIRAERIYHAFPSALFNEDIEYYLRNLPPNAQIFLNWASVLVMLLPRERQRRFIPRSWLPAKLFRGGSYFNHAILISFSRDLNSGSPV